MNISVSWQNWVSASEVVIMGAYNNVSAIVRSLPGIYETIKVNFINPILNLLIQAGSSSRFFISKSDTKGLCY